MTARTMIFKIEEKSSQMDKKLLLYECFAKKKLLFVPGLTLFYPISHIHISPLTLINSKAELI